MPITVLDYVRSVVGDKPVYDGQDFLAAGVAMTGGCQGCAATIACYNAYPSRSGYWRCADCIGDDGFATVADFKTYTSTAMACPACENADTISETRLTTGLSTEESALECGDCGGVWQP
jgi:hypothetical protein